MTMRMRFGPIPSKSVPKAKWRLQIRNITAFCFGMIGKRHLLRKRMPSSGKKILIAVGRINTVYILKRIH